MYKSFIISGSGGQGVISMGNALASIIMLNDFFVSLCSSYGAEMRGGAVNCEINMSDSEILSVRNDKVDYVVALNQTSFDKFISKVKENGTIIVNLSLAKVNKIRDDIKYISAPLTQEAINLGNIKITNSIALGVLLKVLGGFSYDNIKPVFEKLLKNKQNMIQKNLEALKLGLDYVLDKE
ncbi:MAG: 2-oxoacid:acceptor oxidoreductase family protein [Candidatus Gastranaerophilales bacterium]|nr:2-oxoacid:acceptor oxidoreductase family protein [Candidatus Gastranaerophilales bacterium]